MRHSTKNLIKVLFILFLYLGMVFPQTLSATSYSRKDVNYTTFKNVGPDTANDFHIAAIPGGSFKAIAVVSPFNGSGKAFPRKDSDPPAHSLDWTTADNNIPIAMGDSMMISFVGNSPDPSQTYFTHNGVRITTKQVENPFFDIDRMPPDPLRNGNIVIHNPDSVPVIFTGLSGTVDNLVNPVDTIPFNPTGTPIPGFPTTLVLSPGDSLVIPFLGTDPLKFVAVRAAVAPLNNQNDRYIVGAVTYFVVDNAVPTMNEWGLIILGGLLVGFAIFFIRKTA